MKTYEAIHFSISILQYGRRIGTDKQKPISNEFQGPLTRNSFQQEISISALASTVELNLRSTVTTSRAALARKPVILEMEKNTLFSVRFFFLFLIMKNNRKKIKERSPL